MTNNTYTVHILDNGLTVLLRENHSAPVISHWVWYRVGTRCEVPGRTGISHWVEHMQFKGTKRYPCLEAARMICRNGGTLNAFTSLDCTAFHEIMPADRIGLAVGMEADRMINSLFDPKEVELERNVIISEKESEESEVTFRLSDSMLKAAFPNHPYGKHTIGEIEDLRSLTRNDLYEHYRTWYVPNNAVVTAAGDFETNEMLGLIEASFGDIPAQPVPEMEIPSEKPIRGPLKFTEHGSWGSTEVQIEWRVPGANDPAIPSLTLLNSILTGADSLNVFENSNYSNRTSRLFQKLVSGGMTADICGDYNPTLDPFILRFSTIVKPGITAEEVIEAVFSELESIAREGVRPAEIEKARKQAKAIFAYSEEDVTCQASWMGQSAIFGDPDWYTNYMDRLKSVDAEDIRRIAETVFRRDNCVIGVYLKKEEQE